MKKVYVILFGLFLAFAGSAIAADINDVSSDAWIDHVSQMQVMRQQILNLLTKQSPTVEDKEMLAALQQSFSEKKEEWDNYLQDVADGKTEVKVCATCGQNPCACVKAPTCNKCEAGKAKIAGKSKKEGTYHRYEKKPRRHFEGEYHRYDKKYRKPECGKCADKADKCAGKCSKKEKMMCKKGCECPKCQMKKAACKDKCASKAAKCEEKAAKCNEGKDCHTCPKQKKEACCKVSGKCSEKKEMKCKKGCECPKCQMKKSACKDKCTSKGDKSAAKCEEKAVKCNDGKDCPSCPKFKSKACCKVSGVCSKKKEMKKAACPLCQELKLMGISKKCENCSK